MSKNDDSKYANKPKYMKNTPHQGGANNYNKANNISSQTASNLKNVRIIQKHLVYVIGLSSILANKDVKIYFNIYFLDTHKD